MLAQSIAELITVESAHTDEPAEWVNACLECKQACLETVVFCSEKGGKFAERSHLQPLLDCAMLCEPSAYFIARGSDLQWELCRMCLQLCRRCIQECESFAEETQMQACAEACRRCAESCERIAYMTSPVRI